MVQGTRLTGKVAIITGGASGFGAAIALRFVLEGARVLICDINTAGAESTAESIRAAASSGPDSPVAVQTTNVTSAASWAEAVQTCVRLFERLDIVVNNAGTSYANKASLDVTEDEFQRCFDVNVKSVFLSIKACVPIMQQQREREGQEGKGGVFINVASTGSKRPRPGLVWYNSSKGAVENATKGLASEFGPHNIRVNAILPLLSATPLFKTFVGVDPTPENISKFIKEVPIGRLTEPSDVANAAVFLADDESAFVTGISIEVDGGKTI